MRLPYPSSEHHASHMVHSKGKVALQSDVPALSSGDAFAKRD